MKPYVVLELEHCNWFDAPARLVHKPGDENYGEPA